MDPSRCTGSTSRQAGEALQRALWARTWRKRSDLSSDYERPADHAPTRIEPVGIAMELAVAPEGAMVDPERISELRRRAKSDLKVSATLARWALEAERARTGWTIGKGERSTESEARPVFRRARDGRAHRR